MTVIFLWFELEKSRPDKFAKLCISSPPKRQYLVLKQLCSRWCSRQIAEHCEALIGRWHSIVRSWQVSANSRITPSGPQFCPRPYLIRVLAALFLSDCPLRSWLIGGTARKARIHFRVRLVQLFLHSIYGIITNVSTETYYTMIFLIHLNNPSAIAMMELKASKKWWKIDIFL